MRLARAGSHAKRSAAAGRRIAKVVPPSDLVVYTDIAAAIFEQRLPPGTKLTEDTLGGIFGVSRTIVRHALMRLAHEKIVEMRPNRGAIVASPSAEEAQHVFEARRVVEQAIVARAAKAITRGEIARLEQLTDEERRVHDRGDRRAWVRLSGAFHLELARIAGNRVLADFLKDLVSRTSLIVALKETPAKSACASHEHRAVLDAIAAGDVARAMTLMNRHLQSCKENLHLGDGRLAVDLREVFRDTAKPTARWRTITRTARNLAKAMTAAHAKQVSR